MSMIVDTVSQRSYAGFVGQWGCREKSQVGPLAAEGSRPASPFEDLCIAFFVSAVVEAAADAVVGDAEAGAVVGAAAGAVQRMDSQTWAKATLADRLAALSSLAFRCRPYGKEQPYAVLPQAPYERSLPHM